MPLHFSKGWSGSFLEIELCWRAGRWRKHRQAQYSSLTMCHSKALKISVPETPGLLLNLGHWQHKALLKAPARDTDLPRTIPHLRDTATANSALHNYDNLGLGSFFIVISCSAPAVVVSLAEVSSQRQSLYQKASDLPSALPPALIRCLFSSPL